MDTFFQKIIKISFLCLFIIVPLILTPWNYELFEFNKMLAVYALTSIIVGAWIGRMILQKKFIFTRTPFDIPLVVFLTSQFSSTLLSIDRHTSFWGYYSRFHGGLLSTICYLLLYWAFVSNMDKKSALFSIHSSLFTATFVALYGIAEHFGIDAHLWVQDVKTRVFSTLGQPNWLAAYLAALLPLTIHFSLKPVEKSTTTVVSISTPRFVYIFLFILFSLCFLYTKSQSGLLGLGVALAIFWLILFLVNSKTKFLQFKFLYSYFFILTSLFLLLFSTVGLSGFPQIAERLEKLGLIKNKAPVVEISLKTGYQPPALETGGTASGEIRKIVWKGALEIWKHYPIFGSGVETFAYSYYNFRPVEHNLVSEWDFLYNKAHNEYLNYLATTGLVGLTAYLILIGSFIIWVLTKIFNLQFSNFQSITNSPIFKQKKIENLGIENSLKIENLKIRNLLTAFLSGFISILITNFFGFSVVPVALLFFLIPAFCVVLSTLEDKSQSPITNYPITKVQKISLITLFFVILYSLFFILKLWFADYYYAQGERLNKAGQPALAFQSLLKAINLNKKEPVYRNEIAESAAVLALAFSQQNDATTAANFAQVALSQSEQALKISPRHLNFWKGRIKVLYSLSQINKEFAPLVIEAFQNAITLAPTDPKLRYNLGIVYGNFNQKDQAIKNFQKAVELKPNYKDARFALALYLKDIGKKQEAKEQLEYILKNISQQDSPSSKLLKELE